MTKKWIFKEVKKMYFEQAVERINGIDWELFGIMFYHRERNDLGGNYLRNLALFFHEQNIPPFHPLFTNVAEFLGYHEKVDLKYCCNTIVDDVLKYSSCPRRMIECHLQLAKLIDMDKTYEKYLKIYEPMIGLIELGFYFAYREGGLDIPGQGLYPLHNWYERFLKKCRV